MATASDMLLKLASGVRPSPATSLTSPAPGKTPVEAQGFAELLNLARSAGPERPAPVFLAKGSKIDLSPEQLSRMGRCVDAAEASGAARLLAIIDGQHVIVDVATRTVAGTVSAADALVADVDAVAVVPDAPPDTAPPVPAAPDATAPGAASTATPPAVPSRSTQFPPVPPPSPSWIRNAGVSRLLASLHADG